MDGRAFVGCSGWSYRDWAGEVYPSGLRPGDWFPWYAQHFTSVEINATFYRLPAPATVQRWAAQAPPGFVYACKLGSYGTHRRKLREPEPWLRRHVEVMSLLGESAGPTLVQLPPRWHRDTPRLDAFLAVTRALLPAGRVAVEVRDPTWLHDDVFAVLERHGAALCIHDLLPDHPWVRTAGWAYLRFHGPDATRAPYRGRYGARRLAPVAEALTSWRADGSDVYAYFDNDVGGDAFRDALWLRDALASTADRPSPRAGRAGPGVTP